jgi:hypothetical protein
LLLLFILVAIAYGVWCCSRVLGRAGHNRAWALLMIVPVVNLGLVWLFAYARWPRLDERVPIPPEDNRYMPPRPGAPLER